MSVDQQPTELAAPLGWVVTDPDGNVVDSGQMTIAQPAFLVGEGSDAEGAQE